MSDPTLSDDADARYRPIDGPDTWAAIEVDDRGWADATDRLDDLCRRHPTWSDMVLRGARLAAAHQSGALDGVHDGGRHMAMALLRGVPPYAAAVGTDAWPHVRANDEALSVAVGAPAVTEDVLRTVHEVACRPQLTHRVVVDGCVQDHVFAHGDYKHHPNHVPLAGGEWRAHSPVAMVGAEMRHLVESVAGPGYSRLHPAGQAAFALHGVAHVSPFADGDGRVGRALAGAVLLRAAGIPLLVPTEQFRAYDDAVDLAGWGDAGDLVRFVLERSVDLAGLLCGLEAPATGSNDPAFARWCAEVSAAQALGDVLPVVTERALERHRCRTDLGWLSPLDEARVVPQVDAGSLVVAMPLAERAVVEEVIAVDAHPLDADGVVVVRAQEARLRMGVPLGEPADVSAARLGPWLDRVISTLALRVAAESE